MSIESDLKKDGIEILEKLDQSKVDSIAKNVSIRLCATFPYFNFDQRNLFIKLSKLDMYIAKMPEGMAEANYFYKNSSIYFNEHISYDKLEDFAIHECIHYIQEVKDNKNYLIKMGLCDYTEFKIYGLGLNEAAVQLMSSKILGTPKEYVKYYNVAFETNSPTYYPLQCCLVNQLAYLVGENVLFDSTINGNDIFKEKLIKLIGYKNFIKILNYIDQILFYEEKIIKINNKIVKIDDRNKKVDHMIEKINALKNSITSTFISAQNLIISSYFNKALNSVNTLEDVENYRRKLYNLKNYLGSTDKYTYFNNYYVNKMMDLEEIYNLLENKKVDDSLYLVPKKQSKILTLFNFIRNIFVKNRSKQTINNEQ